LLMKKIHLEQAKEIKVKYHLPQFNFSFNFKHLAPVLAICLVLILAIPLLKEKTLNEQKTVNIIPQPGQKVATEVTDEEIIKNLDVFANLDLLENLDLYTDLEVIKDLEV